MTDFPFQIQRSSSGLETKVAGHHKKERDTKTADRLDHHSKLSWKLAVHKHDEDTGKSLY